jgi:hypothetical protein
MSFLIHVGFPGFFKHLKKNSIVYTAAYSEARREEIESVVLLTSDGGVENGMIHALRLGIEPDGAETKVEADAALRLAVDACDKIEDFLTSKGLSTREGVLLTAGAQEALRYWGSSIVLKFKELEELLAQGKEVQLSE